MVWKDTWYNLFLFEYFVTWFVSYHMIHPWKCSMWSWEKNMYIPAVGWNILYISFRIVWCIVSCSSTISLLILCLDDIFIIESGIILLISHIKTSNYYCIAVYFLLVLLVFALYIHHIYVTIYWYIATNFLTLMLLLSTYTFQALILLVKFFIRKILHSHVF